jgi:hypothetical protein
MADGRWTPRYAKDAPRFFENPPFLPNRAFGGFIFGIIADYIGRS